jgi:FlaA1/EpsC-like NDP-sugar epimerase
MQGGEIYVKKIPSMSIRDIAKAVSPEASHKIIGIRPGEKIHEQMIGMEDAPNTYEYFEHYKILPMIHGWSLDASRIKDGKKVPDGFTYTSENNVNWMSVGDLRNWIDMNKSKVGSI